MKKFSALVGFLLLVVLLYPTVMLASYDYYIPVTVYNNNSGDLAGVPVLITLNNSQLADLGYILASGLDTAVLEGASSSSYMVANGTLGVAIPSILGYQSRTYNYRLGVDPAQSDFPLIVGSGGTVTYSDHADLEFGNDFNLTYEGWVDTSYPTLSYPVVENTTESVEDISVTSHYVNLTSGITAGDLLIIIFGGYETGSDPDITWADGWASLLSKEELGRTCGVAYKIADGSENINVTVTTDDTCYSAHQSYRVSGYSGVPVLGDAGYDFDNNQDPPALVGPWANQSATLWIAGWGGGDGTNVGSSSIPTSYTNELWTESASGYADVGSARREATVDSEDPAPDFTVSDDVGGYAFTIGIRGEACWGQIIKNDAFRLVNSGSNELQAQILGGSPGIVTVTGLTSGEYLIDVWADGTNFGIDIDGSTENSTALSGASVPDNASSWIVFVSAFNSYKHYVNGTQEAWYQPNTMVSGTTLPDRSGNGRTGAITWGSTPSGIEVTIGGMEPFSSYIAPGAGDPEVPDVVPPPGGIDMVPAVGATGEGLPLYVNFQRAAEALDWTVPNTYAVMFMIVAIVVGMAGAVGARSIWGWVVGFGGTAALFGAVQDVGGYSIMPLWFTIICVAFAIFTGYVWRYT